MFKKSLVTGTIFCFLMSSCSEKKPENTSNLNPDAAGTEVSVTSEEAEDLSLDIVSNIVNKGGAKAEEQVMIEKLLSEMNVTEVSNVEYSKLLGHWVGSFGKNKINITLAHIDGQTAEGYSVCAGNFRKIVGTYKKIDHQYFFEMNEPGTDKYDGVFEFMIDTQKNSFEGRWTPFIAKGNSEKTYDLKKTEYAYNPEIGDYPEASKSKLDRSHLENLYSDELGYMRNEIYARHGYSFKNKDWRYQFESKDWYVPMGLDIRHKLTPLEIQNISLIYEYESYFDEYYDDYGR